MILYFKKIKLIAFVILLIITISCISQVNKKDYLGEWVKLSQIKSEFVIIKCDYAVETLKVSENSIFEYGIMEDSNYKINNIKDNDKEIILFTEKDGKSYFKFTWLDKERGIAKWQIVDNNFKIDKYFVLKTKIKGIKTVKGTKADCVTSDDVGDQVNDSFVLNNNNIFSIENDNCILLKDKKEEILLENCFDGTTIKIRHISKEFIPLTFISGQHSMDINFYKKNSEWLSKSVTYYKSISSGDIKNTQNIEISLKGFEFNTIKEKFNKKSASNPSSSFDVIKDKNALMNLDIYAIADILTDNPVSIKNVSNYNDAAYYLIEGKNYNEARIILLEIVKFSPDRIVAYLNLADAEWGFDEKQDAKKSYQKYIELMKKQGKDLKKIPKRAYDRIM